MNQLLSNYQLLTVLIVFYSYLFYKNYLYKPKVSFFKDKIFKREFNLTDEIISNFLIHFNGKLINSDSNTYLIECNKYLGYWKFFVLIKILDVTSIEVSYKKSFIIDVTEKIRKEELKKFFENNI
ncbi:hypothetical protein OAQ99_05440 [Candidatus Kapabacteria bacterium]|nr:hypothetical protein [Candidatus Kapabacteria bacterium]